MKTFLVILTIIVVLVFVGWLSFKPSSDQTTITIETGEIKEATQDAVEEGKELLDGAGTKLREAVDEAPEVDVDMDVKPNEDSAENQPAPQETP